MDMNDDMNIDDFDIDDFDIDYDAMYERLNSGLDLLINQPEQDRHKLAELICGLCVLYAHRNIDNLNNKKNTILEMYGINMDALNIGSLLELVAYLQDN